MGVYHPTNGGEGGEGQATGTGGTYAVVSASFLTHFGGPDSRNGLDTRFLCLIVAYFYHVNICCDHG